MCAYSAGVTVTYDAPNNTVYVSFHGEHEYGIVSTAVEDSLSFSVAWPRDASRCRVKRVSY